MFKGGDRPTPETPCQTCPKRNLLEADEPGFFGLAQNNILAINVYRDVEESVYVSSGMEAAQLVRTYKTSDALQLMDLYEDELPTKQDKRYMLRKLKVLDSVQMEEFRRQRAMADLKSQ